jgi:hypothetical protein
MRESTLRSSCMAISRRIFLEPTAPDLVPPPSSLSKPGMTMRCTEGHRSMGAKFPILPGTAESNAQMVERVTLRATGARLVQIGSRSVACRRGGGGASCGGGARLRLGLNSAQGGLTTPPHPAAAGLPEVPLQIWNWIYTLFSHSLTTGNGHMSNVAPRKKQWHRVYSGGGVEGSPVKLRP